MCFTIDKAAKRPTQTRVFKVVRLIPSARRGSVSPEVTSPFRAETKWTSTSVHRIAKDAITHVRDRTAREGIYVILSREEAEKAVEGNPYRAVLELIVDPKDWLFTSNCFGAATGSYGNRAISATYRKVTVAPRQRYLQWVK